MHVGVGCSQAMGGMRAWTASFGEHEPRSQKAVLAVAVLGSRP